ncbi:MAG: PA0069 family radical SAM protein [Rhodospirillales bacterium]|nr:PA0069 family radical SAM protein [Rhodospirillales bacterium]
MVDTLPDQARKGRGAVGNAAGRFDARDRVRTDDGWWQEKELAEQWVTDLKPDASRTILTRNTSPDIPFDRSINPYKGCEHGCIYCFARRTHSYVGLSPGLDFETKVFFKSGGAALLEKELRKPGYQCAPIALGVNTDAYQPAEKELGVTRDILQVLHDYQHPVSIITKSARILRDLDLLAPLAAKNLAHVMISITTLDPALARVMEPRASAPANRLKAMEALNKAGVPTGLLASPMIPALNDMELEAILAAAAESEAVQAGYIFLRLPNELRELFEDWLRMHFPDRADRVLSLIRQSRSGALNSARFGERMRGTGPYADMLNKRFKVACKKLGISRRNETWAFDTSLFQPPSQVGDQMRLL